MNASKFYIHIGYHKTGTTFLQKHLFPQLSANLLLTPDVTPIAQSDPFDPRQFIAHLRSQAQSTDHPYTILSQETLTGRADGNPIWDAHHIARRLRETFPNAKVLIVIRNQFDYILSLYAFRVVRRGLETRTVDDYLAAKQQQLMAKLQYDRLIGDYFRLFGPERVFVLPYELLAANAHLFAQQVAAFFDHHDPIQLPAQRSNVSTRNGRFLHTSRRLNIPFAFSANRLLQTGIISQRQYTKLANAYFAAKGRLINPILENHSSQTDNNLTMPNAWFARLSPIFKASNRRLMNLAALDLGQYDYPVKAIPC